MHATNRVFLLLIFFISLFASAKVQAYDEQWGIFQFRQRFGTGEQVFSEFVRRDTSDLFSKRFLNLYRLSYGAKLSDEWAYLVGAAFLDFETGGDERRLHQFFLYNRRLDSTATLLGRVGLEERQFNGDDRWYWRARARLQANIYPESSFGLAVYDEVLYVPDGGSRLATGLNENRFGVGPRYNSKNFEAYVYHVSANLRTLKRIDRLEWLQLQLIVTFD